MAFVKLDCSILYSSVWCESLEVRVLWVAMLAAADPEGTVRASAPGLAKLAGLPLDATLKALDVLQSPDPFSKSPEHEGRRVERVDGGYFILNYGKYRSHDYSMNREAMRKREYREKTKHRVGDIKRDIVPPCPGHSASAFASGSALEEKENPGESPNPRRRGKKGDLDLLAEYVLAVLKIPMSDKAETEKLLKAFGLAYMMAAVDRMAAYFAAVRENGWTKYIIGRHWRNLYEKLEYFSSDENLQRKLDEMRASRAKDNTVDGRTVSGDFSADEELARRGRERWGIEGEAGHV